MIIKVKKLYKNRIVKFLANGEIKEVLVNEDIFYPETKRIQIFFKNHRDSGFVELSSREAEELYDTLKAQLGIIKGIKVIQSKK